MVWCAASVTLVMSADVFVCVVRGLSPRSVNVSMSKTVGEVCEMMACLKAELIGEISLLRNGHSAGLRLAAIAKSVKGH